MQRNTVMPACASCKHQRKKCTQKCVLAPFFPADRTREFQAVHKVFGVSNATKIVRGVREEDRKKAVDSLVWEAFCRQKDPVLGPYGEYRKVFEELKLYKSQYQQIHAQGSLVCKAAPSVVGWSNDSRMLNKGINGVKLYNNNDGNNSNDNNNNNGLNYIYSNRSSFPDLSFSSSNHHMHLANGLNQQYYVSGN
ncbi:hypothetical protein NMG60_11019261 [Bertholletia excelsa]